MIKKEVIVVVIIAVFIIILMFLSARMEAEQDNTAVKEVCYEGVPYVKFNTFKNAWGSVKFNKDGSIASCK